jgi:hypothetical protein
MTTGNRRVQRDFGHRMLGAGIETVPFESLSLPSTVTSESLVAV